jgi:hypothetical protein
MWKTKRSQGMRFTPSTFWLAPTNACLTASDAKSTPDVAASVICKNQDHGKYINKEGK